MTAALAVPATTWRALARADRMQLGSRGPWEICRTVVSEQDASFLRLRAIFQGGRGVVPAGAAITSLYRGGTLVMSDTPDELDDLYPLFVRSPRGRVLVNGLGLGCVVRGLLAHPAVEHVDVVEISADLIALVGPQVADPRLEIHHGDAYTYRWPPGTRWDVAWHDVWDTISADNLPEMARLHRRYGGRVRWQGSWCRAECRRGHR